MAIGCVDDFSPTFVYGFGGRVLLIHDCKPGLVQKLVSSITVGSVHSRAVWWQLMNKLNIEKAPTDRIIAESNLDCTNNEDQEVQIYWLDVTYCFPNEYDYFN